MDNPRLIRLIGLFTLGEILMTLFYAIQTARGQGSALVLAALALLALSLALLASTVWRRSQRHRHVFREDPAECEPLHRPLRAPRSG